MKNKRLTAFYLYEDRHAIAVYEKYDADAARYIKFAELHEKFVPDNFSMNFKGRLIIDGYYRSIIDIIKRGEGLEIREPSINRGSDKTRRLNIAVGRIVIYTNKGEIVFNHMPDILGDGFTYQPDVTEVYNPHMTSWCDYNIAKIHRAE
jgi:hypothetical protein